MTLYRREEAGRYEPPACPVCGSKPQVEWVEVGTAADRVPPFVIPVRLICPNGLHVGVTFTPQEEA